MHLRYRVIITLSRFIYLIFMPQSIRKKCHSHEKYVVQHIKKLAYIKKKQYLCSVNLRGYVNIILIIASLILAKLVIIRALLRILDIA